MSPAIARSRQVRRLPSGRAASDTANGLGSRHGSRNRNADLGRGLRTRCASRPVFSPGTNRCASRPSAPGSATSGRASCGTRTTPPPPPADGSPSPRHTRPAVGPPDPPRSDPATWQPGTQPEIAAAPAWSHPRSFSPSPSSHRPNITRSNPFGATLPQMVTVGRPTTGIIPAPPGGLSTLDAGAPAPPAVGYAAIGCKP